MRYRKKFGELFVVHVVVHQCSNPTSGTYDQRRSLQQELQQASQFSSTRAFIATVRLHVTDSDRFEVLNRSGRVTTNRIPCAAGNGSTSAPSTRRGTISVSPLRKTVACYPCSSYTQWNPYEATKKNGRIGRTANVIYRGHRYPNSSPEDGVRVHLRERTQCRPLVHGTSACTPCR